MRKDLVYLIARVKIWVELSRANLSWIVSMLNFYLILQVSDKLDVGLDPWVFILLAIFGCMFMVFYIRDLWSAEKQYASLKDPIIEEIWIRVKRIEEKLDKVK